jgi:hypothetical protein
LYLGELKWALVPIGKRFVKKMVLVTDDPVDSKVIENYPHGTPRSKS